MIVENVIGEGGTEMDELLTINELSDKLKISRGTIERMIKAGKLPFLKVGGQYRFIAGEVMKTIRKQTVSGLVHTLR